MRLPKSLLRVALLPLVLSPAAGGPHAQETEPALGIDANPTGNRPAALQTIDDCVGVASGDTFAVDVFVQDVEDLLAWDLILSYDSGILEVKDRDVEMFQAANEGSDVFDVSEETPDKDGIYTVAALDAADPASPDSGSGVLAKLTFAARGSGRSQLVLDKLDLDDDGVFDRGPLLRNVAGDIIADEDDDSFFDGPIHNAEVRIDEACPGGSAVSGGSDGDGDGDGVSAAVIAAAAAGGGGLLVISGGLIAFLARRRREAGRA